jgi:hypothetical protein
MYSQQIGNALVRHLAFIGRTQETHVTGFIDHEEVFDRVACLLATVILLQVLGIFRAVDGALCTIMPKRGEMDLSFVCVAVSRVANSSAVRAGSKSWVMAHTLPARWMTSASLGIDTSGTQS